jgi:hypothetical protein
MAEVGIDGDQLVVEIEGLDKLWSLRSRLVIPLANIRGASADPDRAGWKGLRVVGSHLPGVITAGTFRVDGEWVFWDVHDQNKDRAIVIELADERYARLVIEVPDPAATVALIERAISV